MADSYDVIGVGVPYLDIVVQASEIPALNRSAPIAGFQFSGGGKVPTALVAVSRLGLSAALVTGLAQDSFGETIRADLEREGVSLRHAGKAERSAVSIVIVDDATKSRTILYSEEEVPDTSVFEAGDEVEARMLQISASGLTERKAIQWAVRKQIPIMLDADYFDPSFIDMARVVTLFIGSEHFFGTWDAARDLKDKMTEIRQSGSKVVVATLGDRGCMLLDESGFREVPAFHVDVVDTTGAGDVFHGAFAVGYLKGWNAYDCAVFSSAVSAMKCRSTGGRAGIPHIEEVKLFLENNYRYTLLF